MLSRRVYGKCQLMLACVCFWVAVHTTSCGIVDRAEPSFSLQRLAFISLDHVTVIPALEGWIICDYDVKDERLLVVNHKSMEIAISAKDSTWKPEVIRGLDSDKFRVWPLGFLSSKNTAIVYYEDKREGFREEIDLNTKTIISSHKIINRYYESPFLGPDKLSVGKEKLAEDIFEKHDLGKVISFVHPDSTRLLVLNGDEKLFCLNLEARTLDQIDEKVYAEGHGELLPHWAGFQDLVTYFKRDKSSDIMELYVANTRGVSKRVYRTPLGDEKSKCFVSFFIAGPTEAWATLVAVKEQSLYTGRVKLEYTD